MKKIAFLSIIIIEILLIFPPSTATVIYNENSWEHLSKYCLPEFPTQTISNFSGIASSIERTHIESTCAVMDISDWPMYGHDSFHTGRSMYNTTDNLGQTLWRYRLDIQPYCSPVIAADGTIYIDGIAISHDGTLKWQSYKDCETAAVVDGSGTIYFGSALNSDNNFYAMYPNGTIKWRIPCSDVQGCPVIAPDGSVIFGEGASHKIVCLYPNGTKKWEYQTNNVVYSSPAVSPDSTVYCGSHDGNIYALYPNGTLKWVFPTGNWVHGSPSIGSDGTVYCGSDNGYLYALAPENGSMKWCLHIGQNRASPTISEDGTLYLGVWEKTFYAINPNGTIKWSFDTSPGKVWGCTAALSNDNTLYFCTCDLESSGGVETIALYTNGSVKWRQPFDSVFSSPAIGRDGTVYIGGCEGADGYLKAFNTGPLRADACGPYSAYLGFPVIFKGYIYGGVPPYTYHWEFGEGNTSIEQNPIIIYSQTGIYNVTFTVTDSEGNSSSNSTFVTIMYSNPIITKPKKAIYVWDIKLIDCDSRVSIGKITVEVSMQQVPSEIDRVEFFMDGKLMSTDASFPYSWTWRLPSFTLHEIEVTAYDTSGKSSTTSINVWKFF